ncbi:putative ATP-grasp-modified RiPP [Streptomyces sp. NBC_01016]|uniref:putative ATP-grasp-modified RiPP n=1 Tax=Streptomyces sp. NBC_01016 TaxID=2903720 RepID=UPI0022560818|nr:putative ATP-grasp-modified RiPP [Streptomyces sp. NBC_01016]MCX4834367.1 putative ATP-grasp-modified RiPP [Streptomyces sp. NBC_01016]
MVTPSRADVRAISPGLLASLGAWTWIGADRTGHPLGIVLLAHPPGRWPHESAESIEQDMRQLADALGLVAPDKPLSGSGPKVTRHAGTRLLIHPAGSRFGIEIPAHPRLVRLLRERNELAVALGLDPLLRGAAQAAADQYVDTGLPRGRLLFGMARTTESPSPIRIISPPPRLPLLTQRASGQATASPHLPITQGATHVSHTQIPWGMTRLAPYRNTVDLPYAQPTLDPESQTTVYRDDRGQLIDRPTLGNITATSQSTQTGSDGGGGKPPPPADSDSIPDEQSD